MRALAGFFPVRIRALIVRNRQEKKSNNQKTNELTIEL